jgi:hypothetical protein
MHVPRLRSTALILAASLGLSACVYDDGYGYGGLSVGYGSGYCDPYWDDCYYGYGSRYRYGRGYYDPYWGWYDGFYYPGSGFYVYDRFRRPFRWSDHHRRHWTDRRSHWFRNRDLSREDRRELRENWRDFRRDRRADRQEFRTDRRGLRQDFREGDITREQFRAGRRDLRRDLRREQRQDARRLRRENRRDIRD